MDAKDELVLELQERISSLEKELSDVRAVAKKALHEMCRVASPDGKFTDVVDELDAVVNPWAYKK